MQIDVFSCIFVLVLEFKTKVVSSVSSLRGFRLKESVGLITLLNNYVKQEYFTPTTHTPTY